DTGDLVMKSRRAALLLPCTRPQELAITLTLTAARDVAVDVTVNGSPLTAVLAGPQEREQRILVPKAPLFRGDNELGLAVSADGDLPVRLHRLVLERAAGR